MRTTITEWGLGLLLVALLTAPVALMVALIFGVSFWVLLGGWMLLQVYLVAVYRLMVAPIIQYGVDRVSPKPEEQMDLLEYLETILQEEAASEEEGYGDSF